MKKVGHALKSAAVAAAAAALASCADSEHSGTSDVSNLAVTDCTTPQLIGCYRDAPTRDLPIELWSSSTNSPAACVAACAKAGYAYAGVQYGRECWCGATYGRYGAASNCHMPCSGASSQTCGGSWANDVYAARPTTDGGTYDSATDVAPSATPDSGAGWSGILDPSRAIDWSKAGASGGIPSRTTICATLSPGATAAQINAALASCPDGQVVQLSAGTFALSGGVVFSGQRSVTLRGMGPDKTFLVFSASTGCWIGGADVCITNGSGLYPPNPGHAADWTGAYTKGTTSITLSNTTGLAPGDILVLDQLNDADTDTGGIWVCSTQDVCSSEGDANVRRPGRSQMQPVVVTGISGNTVTFAPGLYMPNWRSSQAPGAWWDSAHSLGGIGVEDLSMDHTASDQFAGIELSGVRDWWVKNIRSINSNRAAVWAYGTTRGTIRDSYFYGTQHAESQSYGIETDVSSDLLVENNIFEHMANPTPTGEGVTGSVYGYNFGIDDYYVSGGNTMWMQAMNYHHSSGINFHLFEGNDGAGFTADQIHGTSLFATGFRNRWHGWEPGKNQQTDAVHIYSYNRYFNMIGNVLGTTGFHTNYEGYPSSPVESGPSTGGSLSIFMLGWSGNETKYPTFDNDLFVRGSLMRWGNYDTVSNVPRYDAGEVPSALAAYSNAVPTTRSLPASFYLPARPAWWATARANPGWPAVGPDVTGGDLPGVAGHAYSIPAKLCYENTPRDGNGVLLFSADRCY
jgi:hypothetical protein